MPSLSIQQEIDAYYLADPTHQRAAESSGLPLNRFTGVAGASFGASHGESMGLEGVEKRVESVSSVADSVNPLRGF